jgi:O-antigen/teichoic acid export membrane protein
MAVDGVEPVSLRHRMLSGSIWALAGKVANAFAMLAVNALLARLLPPRELGVYFLAFSVVSFGTLLGSLGVNQVVVRFVAESMHLGQFQRTRRVVSLGLCLGLLGALGVGLLYLPFGHVIGNNLFNASALAAVTLPVAVWIVMSALQTLVAETFRGFSDIRWATILGGQTQAGVVLSACLGLLWLLQGQASLVTTILLSAGSCSAAVVLGSGLMYRKVTSLPNKDETDGWVSSREMLHTAWPLLITSLTMFAATQADIWIMGAFRPQTEVAVYGAASRLVILVAMPLVIVNSVVPPLIAGMYAQGRKRELERVLRATAAIVGIPACVVLMAFIFWGGPILGLVFRPFYQQGAMVLALLSLGQVVAVWTGSCGFTLAMTGHQRAMMNINVACGLATVVAGLLVVGPYGSTGVAASVAAGVVIRNLLQLFIGKIKTGLWTHIGFAGLLDLLRTAR